MRRQRAARGLRIKGSCRGRGSKTLNSVALRVRLQPFLPVCGADLAAGLAAPLQVVEGLEPVVYRGWDRQLKLQVGRACRSRPHPQLRRRGVVLKADLEQKGVVFCPAAAP